MSDSIKNKICELLNIMDEDYIVSLTNKGTYKKSIKELEKVNLKIDYEVDYIQATFEDNTICKVNSNPQEFKCTCISRTICKHVIITYLYLKEKEKLASINNIQCENLYNNLKEVNIEEVIKKLSETERMYLKKRRKLGFGYDIEESSMLKITNKNENIKVSFFPRKPLNEAICSKRCKGICIHKVEALIKYINREEKVEKELELVLSNTINRKEILEKAYNVEKIINEIYTIGLARLPISICQNIYQCSIMCKNNGLYNFEKILRSIGKELELYFNKSSKFSMELLDKLLSKLVLDMHALNKDIDSDSVLHIIGEGKGAYYPIDNITLYGIAKEYFNTLSGYEGISVYFYCKELNKILTLNNTMATYYEGNKILGKAAFKNNVPWDMKISYNELVGESITINNGKINDKGRISTSKDITGYKNKEFNLDEIIEGQIIKNYKDIKIKYEEYTFKFLQVYKYMDLTYDDIKDELIINLIDKENNKIYIKIKYADYTNDIITDLERMYKTNKIPHKVFGKLKYENGKILLYPLAFYTERKIVSLF